MPGMGARGGTGGNGTGGYFNPQGPLQPNLNQMSGNRGGGGQWGGGNPFMGPPGQMSQQGPIQHGMPRVIATIPFGGGGRGGQNPFMQQMGPGLQAQGAGGGLASWGGGRGGQGAGAGLMAQGGGGGWGGWGGPPSPFAQMPQWGGGNPFSQAMGQGMPPNRHPGWMQGPDIRQQSAGGLHRNMQGKERGQQGGPGQFPTRLRSRFDTDFGMGKLQGL